jgi:hypothetical protein
MAVGARYRDKGGEIGRKYGDTLIATLRISYGSGFAQGCAKNDKLSNVLASWMNYLCLSWFATMKQGCSL